MRAQSGDKKEFRYEQAFHCWMLFVSTPLESLRCMGFLQIGYDQSNADLDADLDLSLTNLTFRCIYAGDFDSF